MKDRRLTEHFWLSEFTRSETAARAGIDNTPPPELVPVLLANAESMERVRATLLAPVLISSGYRCEALERLLCKKDFDGWCFRHKKNIATLELLAAAWAQYFGRKQHPKGRATDFTAPAYGPPADVCMAIAASPLQFDQLIYEHTWAHVSWPAPGEPPRRELLTLYQGGYVKGIVEEVA